MKNILKLMLTTAAAFSVVSVLNVRASEINVAEINGTKYATLQEAVNNVSEGETVVLLNDILIEDLNTSTLLEIKADKKVILDLNGHIVDVKSTKNSNTNVILNNGSLTINDSSEDKTGKISYNYNGPSCNYGSWGSYTISNGNGATFVLNGGTIENTTSVANHIYYAINNTTYGEAVTNVTINDGKVINKNYTAIRNFENASVGKVVLTINGGSVTGTTAIYLQNPSNKVFSKGELYINGGTINSTRAEKQAVYVYGYGLENIDGLKIEVNGGTLDGYIHVYPETEEKEIVTTSDTFNVNKETLEYSGGTKSFYYTLECNHKNENLVGYLKDSCTEDGYTGDKECKNCGHVTKGEVITAEGHKHVLDEITVKKATCLEDGYTGDKKCSCGDIVKGEVVKAAGKHTDEDNNFECDACQKDLVAEITADALKKLNNSLDKGNLADVKAALAYFEEVSEKYNGEETEATEEQWAELVELMGCEDKEELENLIIESALLSAYILDVEEYYNAFVENKSQENAKAFIFHVSLPENLEKLEQFFEGITEVYAEAEEIAEKEVNDGIEGEKPEEKPSDDKEEDKNESESPVTSDNSFIGLYAALMAISASILFVLKRKQSLLNK